MYPENGFFPGPFAPCLPRLLLVPMLVALGACSESSPSVDAALPDLTVADRLAPVEGTRDFAAPYTLTLFDNTRINSQGTVNVQKADATLTFDKGPYASMTLHVQLDTTCFPFQKWQTNPPPSGQNWPADCDAFDRNFEFHLDPPKTSSDPPALELVRAITPFGGPMKFDVDLTDYANYLSGSHTLRVTISTWSDSTGKVTGSNGGWNVTAKVSATPGKAPRRVLLISSLYNGSYGVADTKKEMSVTIPSGIKSHRLEYRATGHGSGPMDSACIGPAEEFCQRLHHLYVDGAEFTNKDPKNPLGPWRTDCANGCTLTTSGSVTYCLENPCGAISSVKASRANWCPGSVTQPFTWTDTGLSSAGTHTVGFAIDKVATGGTWRVSATYFAFGE